MMAIAFLAAAYTLSLELKRKELGGLLSSHTIRIKIGEGASMSELLTTAALWFLVGFKMTYAFTHYDEFVADTQGVILSGKGNLLGGLLAAGLFTFLRYREKERKKLAKPEWKEVEVHPHELVGNLTIAAAVGGILGAKIFHNLENLDEFAADPVGSLLSFSGLTMYGGLIVGGAAVLWYGKKKGIPMLHLCDAAAPGLMLAYGVGRIGCQIAGDGDWGIVNNAQNPFSFLPDWAWAYDYPHNVNNVGVPIPGCEGNHCMVLPEPVFPTPLYEAVACILLFVGLWQLRKRISIPGMLFFVYLILNGFERFWIEKIRVNTKYVIAGNEITQAEIISTLLVIGGLAGVFILRKRARESSS